MGEQSHGAPNLSFPKSKLLKPSNSADTHASHKPTSSVLKDSGKSSTISSRGTKASSNSNSDLSLQSRTSPKKPNKFTHSHSPSHHYSPQKPVPLARDPLLPKSLLPLFDHSKQPDLPLPHNRPSKSTKDNKPLSRDGIGKNLTGATKSASLYQQRRDTIRDSHNYITSGNDSTNRFHSTFTLVDMELIESIMQEAYHLHAGEETEHPNLLQMLKAYEDVFRKYQLSTTDDTFYYRFLLKLSVDAEPNWWVKYQRSKQGIVQRMEAYHFRRRNLLSSHFSRWRSATAGRQFVARPGHYQDADVSPVDSFLSDLSFLDEFHYNPVVKREYTLGYPHPTPESIRLDRVSKTLRHFFFVWKTNARLQREERAQAVTKWMKALGFWERSITKRVLVAWKQEVAHARDKARVAAIYCNKKLALGVLRAWKSVAKQRATLKAAVSALRQTHLLRRGLLSFKYNRNAEKLQQQKLYKAVEHWAARVARRCFQQWKEFYAISTAPTVEFARKDQLSATSVVLHQAQLPSIQLSNLQNAWIRCLFRWILVSTSICMHAISPAIYKLQATSVNIPNLETNPNLLALIRRIRPRKYKQLQTITAAMDKRAVKQAWTVWRSWVQEVTALRAKANRRSTSSALVRWMEYTKRRQIDKIRASALKTARDQRVLQSALRVWLLRYVNRLKTGQAYNYYLDTLQKQFFHKWRSKVVVALQIKSELELIRHRSLQRLLHKSFDIWIIQVGIASKMTKAAQFRQVKVIQKILVSWRKYTSTHKELRHRKQIAYDWHMKRVCTRVLSSWRATSSLQISSRTNFIEAINKFMLRNFVLRWLQYVRMRLQLRTNSHIIKSRVAKSQLASYFIIWMIAKRAHMHAKQKVHLAHVFYTRRYLRKIFCAWRGYQRRRTELDHRLSVGYIWLRQQKLKRAFAAWSDHCTVRKHTDIVAGPLSRRTNAKILASYFHSWRRELVRSRRLTELESALSASHYATVTFRVMQIWKYFAAARKKKKEYFDFVMRLLSKKRLHRNFVAWLVHTRSQHTIEVTDQYKTNFIKRIRRAHYFNSWKSALTDVSIINQRAELLRRKKLIKACLAHFVAWKVSTKRRQRNRGILHAIQQQRQKVTTILCLLEWHRVAKNNAIVREFTRVRSRRTLQLFFSIMKKNAEQQVKLKGLHNAVTHRIVTSACTDWLLGTQERLQLKYKGLQATNLHNQFMLRTCFQRWKLYINTKMLTRTATLHNAQIQARHTLSQCWSVWRNAFLERLIDRSKLERAVFFWKEHMLRKAFSDWRDFGVTKKMQMTALTRVFASWKSQLLSISFCKWVTFYKREVGAKVLRKKLAMRKLVRAFQRWRTFRYKREQASLGYCAVVRRHRAEALEKHLVAWVRTFRVKLLSKALDKKLMLHAWCAWTKRAHSSQLTRLANKKLLQDGVTKQQYLRAILIRWRNFYTATAFQTWRTSVASLKATKKHEDTAVAYHNFHMKKASFNIWVEAKARRSKKRLASSAYRYKQISKCIAKWILYMKTRREKQVMAELADQFRNNSLQRYSLNAWCEARSAAVQRTHRADAALQVKQSFIVRRCFGIWIRYWHAKKIKELHKMLADQLRMAFLKRVSFSFWIEKYTRCVAKKELLQQARIYLQNKMLVRKLRGWRDACVRLGAQRQKVAQHSHKRNAKILKQAFVSWTQSVACRKETTLKLANHEQKRRLAQIGKHFQLWQQFIYLRIQDKYVIQTISMRIYKRLTETAFQTWRGSLSTESRKSMFMASCQRRLVHRIFTSWLAKVEKRAAEYKRTKLALLYSCFSRWHTLVTSKREQQKKLEPLVTKRRTRTLQHVLASWKAYTEKSINTNLACALLGHVDKQLITDKVFNTWMLSAHTRRYTREAGVVISAKHRMQLMENAFRGWKSAYTLALDARQANTQRRAFSNRQLLANCIKTWVAHTAAVAVGKYNNQLAQSFFRALIARKYFIAWYQRAASLRRKHEMDNIAAAFHRRTLLRAYLEEWVRRYSFRTEDRFLRDRGTTHLSSKLQQRYFSAWRGRVHTQLEMNRAAIQCNSIVQRGLLQHTWRAWVAALHARRGNQQKLAQFILRRNQNLLQVIFTCWVTYKKAKQIHQEQLAWCDLSHRSNILWRSFAAWVHAYKAKETVREIISLREDARTKRIMGAAFDQWVGATQQTRVTKQKAVLCHQLTSKNLLRDAMTAWIRVFSKRQLKKSVLDKWTNFRARSLENMALTRWRQFVSKRKAIFALYRRSIANRNTRLLQTVFRSWLQVNATRKKVSMAYEQLVASHELRITQFVFCEWEVCSIIHREKRLRRLAADSFRSRTVLWRTLLKWINSFNENRRIKHLNHVAQDHRNKILQAKAFRSWISYIHIRKYYTALAEQSYKSHWHRSLRSIMSRWHLFSLRNKEKQQKEDMSTHWHYVNLMRKLLQAWKKFTKIGVAVKLVERRRGLAYLDHWVRATKASQRLAFNFNWMHDKIRKKRSQQVFTIWRNWALMKRINYDNTRISIKFYQRNMLKKCIRSWKNFLEQCRIKWADTLRVHHLLSSSMRNWRYLVALNKYKRETSAQATAHFESTLLLKSLRIWKLAHGIVSLQRKCMRRKLIERVRHWAAVASASSRTKATISKFQAAHRNRAILRVAFGHWYNLEKAVVQHKLRVEALGFAIFKAYHKRKVAKQARLVHCKTAIRLGILRRALLSWQLHVSGLRAIRSSLKLASRSYMSSVVAARKLALRRMGQAFTAWKDYVIMKQEARYVSAKLYHTSLLKKVFDGWKILLIQANIRADQIQIATKFHDHYLLKKYVRTMALYTRNQNALRAWCGSLARKRMERSFTVWRTVLLCKETCRRALGNCMIKWKAFVRDQQLTRRANTHYALTSQRKAVTLWQIYVAARKRKKNQKNLAIAFNARKLLAFMFYQLSLVYKLRKALQLKRSRTLLQSFQVWQALHERIKAKQTAGAIRAIQAHNLKVLARAFYGWQGVLSGHMPRNILRSLRVAEHTKRRHSKSLRRIVQSWNLLVQQKKDTTAKLVLADNLYQRNILSKSFLAWQESLQSRSMDRSSSPKPLRSLHLKISRPRSPLVESSGVQVTNANRSPPVATRTITNRIVAARRKQSLVKTDASV